jgi:hypothetical protein
MKIQDLAAQVGGFIKLILLGFQILLMLLNKFEMKAALISSFFVENNKESTKIIPEKLGTSIAIRESFQNNLDTRGINFIEMKNNYLSSTDSLKDYSTYKKGIIKSYTYGVKDSIQYMICNCCLSRAIEKKKANQKIACQVIDERLEILNYLKMTMEIDRMKQTLLSELHRRALESKYTINLDSTAEIDDVLKLAGNEKMKDNESKLIVYFKEKLKIGPLNESDNKFFSLLEDCMKRFILKGER